MSYIHHCLFYKILLIKFKFNIYKIKINKFTSNGFFRHGLFKPLRVLVKIKKFVKMKIRRGYNYVLLHSSLLALALNSKESYIKFKIGYL